MKMHPGNYFFKSFIVTLFISGMLACSNEPKESPKANSADPADPEFSFDRLVGTWQSADGKDFERMG